MSIKFVRATGGFNKLVPTPMYFSWINSNSQKGINLLEDVITHYAMYVYEYIMSVLFFYLITLKKLPLILHVSSPAAVRCLLP